MIRAYRDSCKNALIDVCDGSASAPEETPEPILGLPTEATDSQALDYDGLYVGQTDDVINQLYSDGYCTNCVIDLSNNGAPTAASAVAYSGLESAGNTLITD